MKRRCYSCNLEKDVKDFYKDKSKSGGYDYKCKDCKKKSSSEYRKNNREKYLHYFRTHPRINSPARLKYLSEYAKSHPQKERDKKELIAQRKLQYAVDTGKIIRLPCSICGKTKSEAHHPDYSKPLEVIWFCRSHHKLHHARTKFPY